MIEFIQKKYTVLKICLILLFTLTNLYTFALLKQDGVEVIYNIGLELLGLLCSIGGYFLLLFLKKVLPHNILSKICSILFIVSLGYTFITLIDFCIRHQSSALAFVAIYIITLFTYVTFVKRHLK